MDRLAPALAVLILGGGVVTVGAAAQSGQPVTTLPAPVRPGDGPPNFGPPPGDGPPRMGPPPAAQRPPPGQRPPQSGQLYAGNIRCESQNNRTQRCSARTQNRVTLVGQQSASPCRQGQSWRFDGSSITVSGGCRGTFAYGFGNVRPGMDSSGNALPWLLAGAGATAGLTAIINSGNNNRPPPAPLPTPMPQPAPVPQPVPEAPPPPPPAPVLGPPFPPQPPATIDANLGMLTAAQQPSMQACLFEGARQVGTTGGSAMRVDGIDRIEQGNGGWRFNFRATATYPDRERRFKVFCRATPTNVIEFTVTPL